MRKITHTTSNQIPFAHDELQEALFYSQDVFQRAMIPFVLLEETAKQIKEDKAVLKLPEITLGIQKRHLTKDTRSALKMIVSDIDIDDNYIYFKKNKVPVTTWIIKKRFPYFDAPDTVFYWVGNFYIPNPFDTYWNKRFLIE